MPERTIEKTFGFSYDGWDEAGGDYGDVQFYNVCFEQTWGPIPEGAKFDCVLVEHSKGMIYLMKNGPDGRVVDQTELKWHAVAG